MPSNAIVLCADHTIIARETPPLPVLIRTPEEILRAHVNARNSPIIFEQISVIDEERCEVPACDTDSKRLENTEDDAKLAMQLSIEWNRPVCLGLFIRLSFMDILTCLVLKSTQSKASRHC
jgi:hypothetical protein